jgi:two-component system chemotaxis response regulator CheY
MRSNQRTARAVTSETTEDRHPLRLLIVDDDPVQRELLRRVAMRAGYEVVSASSCREAVALVRSGSFDCVSLDLNLDDGDGIDVCKAMARRKYAGSVIIISGAGADRRSAARAYAKSAGITTRGLPKPVDYSSLRVCLANIGKDIQGLPVIHTWGGAAVCETKEQYRS